MYYTIVFSQQLSYTIEATLEQECMAIQKCGEEINQKQLKDQALQPIYLREERC